MRMRTCQLWLLNWKWGEFGSHGLQCEALYNVRIADTDAASNSYVNCAPCVCCFGFCWEWEEAQILIYCWIVPCLIYPLYCISWWGTWSWGFNMMFLQIRYLVLAVRVTVMCWCELWTGIAVLTNQNNGRWKAEHVANRLSIKINSLLNSTSNQRRQTRQQRWEQQKTDPHDL